MVWSYYPFCKITQNYLNILLSCRFYKKKIENPFYEDKIMSLKTKFGFITSKKKPLKSVDSTFLLPWQNPLCTKNSSLWYRTPFLWPNPQSSGPINWCRRGNNRHSVNWMNSEIKEKGILFLSLWSERFEWPNHPSSLPYFLYIIG